MSIKTLSTAVAFALVAGAAAAQTVSPGDAQLAALAGVEPGVYSRAQLIQLNEARRDGDANRVRFILGQTGADASRNEFGAASPVVGSGLTAAEQLALTEARRENDRNTERYILSGANRAAVANPASVVTPGEAQLAALVGVDPADYTLAELVALQSATTDF